MPHTRNLFLAGAPFTGLWAERHAHSTGPAHFSFNRNAFAYLACGTPPTGVPFAGLWAERHAHSTGPATTTHTQNFFLAGAPFAGLWAERHAHSTGPAHFSFN